ncbi:MAG: DUF4870 domain-containing protein [Clostridia bacterium]|nr:DUF4870 domain-containing protein [Clostridia bacterium]
MNQNVRGVLAYILGIIGAAIVLAAYKDNDSRTKFNCFQSITLSLISIIAGIIFGVLGSFVSFFTFVSSIISILIFACCIIGAVKAYKEQDCELPGISDLTRKIFSKQLD